MSRILLIDDELSTRLVTQNRLKDLGFEVVAAENGAKGLAEAREGSFDLILVDADLQSGVSGYEVCRRLKQTPQTLNVPLVMFSKQSANREDARRGYEVGCEAYLLKGDSTVLDEVARAMLRIKAVHDEQQRQIHALDSELRRVSEDRQRGAESDHGPHGADSQRDVSGVRPDGILLVDADGIVRWTDRGARELLGGALEGRNLGRLAPATGLEAFVRDVRSEPREGFRFDVGARGGRTLRSLTACAHPLVAVPGQPESGLRVVLLHDASRRRLASELARLDEYVIPRREVGVLLDAARVAFGASTLVGPSAAMVQVRAQVTIAAGSGDPVLITGEEGTGKKHVARALHYSGELGGPFLPVGCAALSPENLEVELFGAARNHSGAAERPGLFQQAQHGTLFLEDVEALSPDLQRKLLKALRDGKVSRTGSPRAESVEVRAVLATTRDLAALVRQGDFLSEPYQLVSRFRIHIPPLRERREDVVALAQLFLERYGSARPRLEISPDALWVLENYDWPGNVRELESCIKRACGQPSSEPLGQPPEEVVEVAHLTQPLRDLAARLPRQDLIPSPERVGRGVRVGFGSSPAAVSAPAYAAVPSGALPPGAAPGLDERKPWEIGSQDPISLDHYEMKVLLRAIDATGGDKLAAARLLKVGKSTLYRKLKRYGIR